MSSVATLKTAIIENTIKNGCQIKFITRIITSFKGLTKTAIVSVAEDSHNMLLVTDESPKSFGSVYGALTTFGNSVMTPRVLFSTIRRELGVEKASNKISQREFDSKMNDLASRLAKSWTKVIIQDSEEAFDGISRIQFDLKVGTTNVDGATLFGMVLFALSKRIPVVVISKTDPDLLNKIETESINEYTV